jgi:2'-5' RNA ligase
MLINRNPKSYSIWLMPENPVKKQIQKKINYLGSDFNGPIFEPHVTLIGGVLGDEKMLIEKTRKISRNIQPFKIIFDDIHYLNEFFRSLFIKIKYNKDLVASRKAASKELGFIEEYYLPHLSLIYGDYTIKQKEKMISSFGSVSDSFEVNNIYLAHNDELNLKWRVIMSFPLNN